jgi:hypothetical protein
MLPAALAALIALVAGAVGVASIELARPPDAATGQFTAQDEDGICPPGERDCEITDQEPGAEPGGSGDQPGGGGGGACMFNNGSGGGAITVSLAQSGLVEVPCTLDGMWYDGTGCYYGPPDFNWNNPPPEGKTEEDGRWYSVHCLMSVRGELPSQSYFFNALRLHAWVDFADVPTVTPGEVALAWLASVGLDGVQIRLAPPETGAGLVGLPVWLGIEETGSTWGPINDTHCIGSVCVSIEAMVTEVEWSMGDGTVLTCTREQHVAWRSGMDFRAPGSNCHHYYQRASRSQPDQRYPITATSQWLVSWSSTGDAGVLDTARTATAGLRIDEIQVLRSR